MRDINERPEGVIIKELCLCGCGEHIIHSYNRIKRGLPPPLWKWGHFGWISLKKFRFVKGHVPWDKGIPRSEDTCNKISETKRANKIRRNEL